MSAVLEANQLGKRYGSRSWALDSVDLVIEPGAVVALVGPNGAGKSTLVRTWMGFERPTRGHALVAGHDSWNDRSHALEHIGYVSQAPAIYEQLTVDEHLQMASHLRTGFDDAAARSRLVSLEIPLKAGGAELSGGQQAQVVLSIALGCHPAVLLLDEPLAQLDPLARREFLQMVERAARAEGTTVVLSSHVITDLEAICDSLIVLAEGRVRLDMPLRDASEQFFVAEASGAGDAVGTFPGADGAPQTLLRREAEYQDQRRPATLEEVVLGHLAASRSSRGSEIT